MAVAFSVYQFSYRDALRTVGLQGAVVTGFVQLASHSHPIGKGPIHSKLNCAV